MICWITELNAQVFGILLEQSAVRFVLPGCCGLLLFRRICMALTFNALRTSFIVHGKNVYPFSGAEGAIVRLLVQLPGANKTGAAGWHDWHNIFLRTR